VAGLADEAAAVIVAQDRWPVSAADDNALKNE
jgi:hypothetical protein